MMDDYQKIEGWFSDRDARFYTYQVQRVDGPARFVEIGSWKGRSSYCMADEIRRSGKPIEFWCVDSWEGSEEHRSVESVASGTLFDEFLANVAPVRDHLRTMRVTSLDAAGRFDDDSLDFVFIDAAHDYDNVLADIEAWRPKVKSTGVLAGHDYSKAWPGVVRAVEAAFDSKAKVYGACWYVAQDGRAAPPSLREFHKSIRRQVRRHLGQSPFSRPVA